MNSSNQTTSLSEKATLILQYMIVVFTTIGIGLNIVTFAIFTHKKFQRMAFSFYFRVLLVSDIFHMIINYRIFPKVVYTRSLDRAWIGLCELLEYLSYIAGAVSIWTIGLILLDRFLIIAYLQRISIIKKRKFQILAVFIVFVFNSLYYVTIPIYREVMPQNESSNLSHSYYCTYLNQDKAFIVYWSDLINMVLGCLIVNNVLTTLTLICIYESRKRTNHLETQINRDIKFAINSIVLNFFVFIFQTPISVILIVNNYYGQSNVLFSIGVLLFTFRCSISFIANMISNSIFYSQALIIFRLKSK